MAYWGFGNTAGLKQVHSYDEIAKHYASVKPIRGRKKDTRPAGYRHYGDRTVNQNWKSIEDDCVGKWQVTYSVNVWGTDRVEWYPDGKVCIKTGGYSNPTINSTVNYLCADTFGELLSVNGKQYFRTKDGNGYIMTKEGLMLEPTGEELQSYGGRMAKVMRPTNAVQEYRYSVNRKVMNALRKKYHEFIQYGVSMFLIDNKVDVSAEELEKFFKKNHNSSFGYANWESAKQTCEDNRRRLIVEIDKFLVSGDLEHAYTLAKYVGRSAAGWYSRCTHQEFKRHFDEILKFQFKTEVFTVTPQPLGTMFYDANGKYFK